MRKIFICLLLSVSIHSFLAAQDRDEHMQWWREVVPGLKNPVASAKELAGGKELKTETTADGLVINVPAAPENKIATVIKLVLKGKLVSL